MTTRHLVQLSPVVEATLQMTLPRRVDPNDPLAPLKRIAMKHAPPRHHVRAITTATTITNEQLPT